MAGWTSVLEQLSALDPAEFDPTDLAGDELLNMIPAVHVGANKLAALLTRVIAAGEQRQVHRTDGMATMKSWLTGHCRMSGNDATGLIHAGRRMSRLPEPASAFDAGAVSAAHVRVITEAVTPARVAKAEQVGIELAVTDEVPTRVLGSACNCGGSGGPADIWRVGLPTGGDDPAAEGDLVTPLHVRCVGSGSRRSPWVGGADRYRVIPCSRSAASSR